MTKVRRQKPDSESSDWLTAQTHMSRDLTQRRRPERSVSALSELPSGVSGAASPLPSPPALIIIVIRNRISQRQTSVLDLGLSPTDVGDESRGFRTAKDITSSNLIRRLDFLSQVFIAERPPQ